MSNKVSAQVYKTGFTNGIEKAVLISIADQANDDGTCYQGSTKTQNLLARVCFGRSAVFEAMKQLKEYGILVPCEEGSKTDPWKIELEMIGEGFCYDKKSATRTIEKGEKVRHTDDLDDEVSPPHGLKSPPHGLDESATRTKESATRTAPIYKEEPSTIINHLTVSARAILEELSLVGCVKACRTTDDTGQIALLVSTIQRYADIFEGEDLRMWAGWIANRAAGRRSLTETNGKTAAALFEMFIPDVKREMARRKNLEVRDVEMKSIENHPDLAGEVATMFRKWKLGGVAYVKDDQANIAEYVRQLNEARITPEIVRVRGEEAVKGAKDAPSAYILVEKLRPYVTASLKTGDFEKVPMPVEENKGGNRKFGHFLRKGEEPAT